MGAQIASRQLQTVPGSSQTICTLNCNVFYRFQVDGSGHYFTGPNAGTVYFTVDRVAANGTVTQLTTAGFTIMAVVCKLVNGQPVATTTTICTTSLSANQRQFVVQANIIYFFHFGAVNAPASANYILTVTFP